MLSGEPVVSPVLRSLKPKGNWPLCTESEALRDRNSEGQLRNKTGTGEWDVHRCVSTGSDRLFDSYIHLITRSMSLELCAERGVRSVGESVNRLAREGRSLE